MESKKISSEDLADTTLLHKQWIKGEGGVRANLTGANLTGANLTGANLTGANLTRANLTGASMPSILSFASNPALLQEIAEKVLCAPSALNMDRWHTCDTTHCLAGWAVALHPDGKRLEENSSTYLAGRLLLGDEAAKVFFASNEEAIKWLKEKTGK